MRILLCTLLYVLMSITIQAQSPFSVKLGCSGEPNVLNPIVTSDSYAFMVQQHIFQKLIDVDYGTNELVPVLAKARPTFIEYLDNDLIGMQMEIRAEATWDNGTPITAEDVAFSLKMLKWPELVPIKTAYFEFIKKFKIDRNNPKKFTIICSKYLLAETILTDLPIIPRYIYDKDRILDKYSVEMIANGQFEKELDQNISLQDFAAAFKSVEFQRNTIIGSNAYSLEEWNNGENIKLVRKQDWWGSLVSSESHWFQAYPDTLIFIFQRDEKKMERLLLDAQVDVSTSIDIDIFKTYVSHLIY